MKWPKWSISAGQGDFLPLVIGFVMLFISLPGFTLLLLAPDRDYGAVGVPLLLFLGIGVVLGMSFLVLGIRLCSSPGSLTYKISHGRIFSR